MITMGVNYKFGSGAPGASGSPGHKKYQDTDEGKEKLAKDAQNPIADLISVPFQNNTTRGVLTMQPSAIWITYTLMFSQLFLTLNESRGGYDKTIQPLLATQRPEQNLPG
jgi:hypothetical protein